jgi:hypothetical protein
MGFFRRLLVTVVLFAAIVLAIAAELLLCFADTAEEFGDWLRG